MAQQPAKRKREEEGMQSPITSDSKEPGKKPKQAGDLIPFWDAIADQDADKVQDFLKAHPEVDIAELYYIGDKYDLDNDDSHDEDCDFYQYTPLLLAVEKGGNKELINLLLSAKADLNMRGAIFGEGSVDPLSLACGRGDAGLIYMLLEAKADPNSIDADKEIDYTPLGLLIKKDHADILKVLLEYKANPNLGDEGYALQSAVGYGHIASLKVLLEAKAVVNVLDDQGDTPLHFACRLGHAQIAAELLKWEADVTRSNLSGKTALECASAAMRPRLSEIFAADARARRLRDRVDVAYLARSISESLGTPNPSGLVMTDHGHDSSSLGIMPPVLHPFSATEISLPACIAPKGKGSDKDSANGQDSCSAEPNSSFAPPQ